jgi:ketosteroid isomerase-like protein
VTVAADSPDSLGAPSPTAVCVGYLEAFSTGTADAVAAFVTDDFVNEHTAALGGGCVGIDEYRQRLPGFLASMPGLRYEIEDVVADGDRVCAAYTLRTTVNDRPIAVRGVMRFVVRDGRIAHRIDYWDSLVFQRQAGLA